MVYIVVIFVPSIDMGSHRCPNGLEIAFTRYVLYARDIFKGITHSNILARSNMAHNTHTRAGSSYLHTRTYYIYMIFVPTFSCVNIYIYIYGYILIENFVRCLRSLRRFSGAVVLSGYNNKVKCNNLVRVCVCVCV